MGAWASDNFPKVGHFLSDYYYCVFCCWDVEEYFLALSFDILSSITCMMPILSILRMLLCQKTSSVYLLFVVKKMHLHYEARCFSLDSLMCISITIEY